MPLPGEGLRSTFVKIKIEIPDFKSTQASAINCAHNQMHRPGVSADTFVVSFFTVFDPQNISVTCHAPSSQVIQPSARRSASPPTLPCVEGTRVCKLNVREKLRETFAWLKLVRHIRLIGLWVTCHNFMRWIILSKLQYLKRNNTIITIQNYINFKYKQSTL